MKTGTKIIHVEFNDENLKPTTENPEGKHFQFGSIAALYSTFKTKDLGACQRRLSNHHLSPEKPFVSKCCTIRESVIVRKETNRKAPVKVIRII